MRCSIGPPVAPPDLSFRTERLLVRPWQRADLDAAARWPPFADPLERTWSWPEGTGLLLPLDLLWASHEADPSRRTWAILLGDTLAGLLQLKAIRHVERDAFLGIVIGAPWSGQGLGREALAGFMPVCFDRLGLDEIRLEVSLANLRALRLYEQFGFAERTRFWRYAGLASEYAFLRAPAYAGVQPFFRWSETGVYQLCAEMALTAECWQARSEG